MPNFGKALNEFKTLMSSYWTHPLMGEAKGIAASVAHDARNFGRTSLLKAGGMSGVGLRAGVGAAGGVAAGAGYSYAMDDRVDARTAITGGLLGAAAGAGYGAYRGLRGGYNPKYLGNLSSKVKGLANSTSNYSPVGKEGFMRTASGPLTKNSRGAAALDRALKPTRLALPPMPPTEARFVGVLNQDLADKASSLRREMPDYSSAKLL